MLRVGLTGELGSGKSTVAAMLRDRGAHVWSSDEMAHAMMQPGQAVYGAIVEHFGHEVLTTDAGALPPDQIPLDRRMLAKLAFEQGRVEELNAIVHPAVIAEQSRLLMHLGEQEPNAVAVVESALLLSTQHADGPWHRRFDEVVVVTAPEKVKLQRFVDRAAAGGALSAGERERLLADAAERLRVQRQRVVNDPDFVILRNDGDRSTLQARVDALWLTLWRKANR